VASGADARGRRRHAELQVTGTKQQQQQQQRRPQY
jgi:hypothetical protein